MAQDLEEFSQLWQRHLSVLRDDFSTTSVQALPSQPSGSRTFDSEGADYGAPEGISGHDWDENTGDALDELTLQSPNTADTHSPGTAWFLDRDDTETALSSPVNSSWLKTSGPTGQTVVPHLRVEDYSDIPFPQGKGKAVDTTHDGRLSWCAEPKTPFLLKRQFIHDNQAPYPSLSSATATATAATALHSPLSPAQNPPPSHVHVLILTWAKHDRRGADGQLLSPSLDGDTEMLRACLKRRGYRVQCRSIPVDYPTAAVETLLGRFLERSTRDGLLMVYYCGHGCLDGEGRMVFSSPNPSASSFFWDDVRDPIMQLPGDVLLVFDCTALPGVSEAQREISGGVEVGMVSSASTKQLLGVCIPASSNSDESATAVLGDDMTRSLCRTLDMMGDLPVLSVQKLCSLMREDLRGTGLSSRVFVSQLGGGRLLDIYLPRLAGLPRATR